MEKVVVEVEVKTGESEKDLKKLKNQLENVQKETKETQDNFQELGGLADGVFGGAITKTKGFASSIGGVIKGMKTLKGALISTGIGALIVAFGSLITFFTKTERGADKLREAFAGIKAATDVIIDRISGLGESLTKLFKGDWRGALDSAKDQFKGLGDEIQREVELARELEKSLIAIENAEIKLITSGAELRKSIAQDKLIAEDTNKTFAERVAALDRVLASEDKLLQLELDIATQRRDTLKEQLALGESSREDRKEYAEVVARVSDLETESLTRQKEAFTRRQALLKEQQAFNDAYIEQEIAKKLEGVQKVEAVDDLALARFKVRIEKETQLRAEAGTQQLKNYQKQKEEETKADKLTNEQKLKFAGDTLGQIAGLLGANSRAGKAAASAQALINTYQGVTQVWKNETTLPEPFGTIQKIVATATTLSSGLQAVRAINSTPIPNIPTRGGYGGGGGGVVASAPPAFNVIGQAGTNQLANVIAEQRKEPVKAYVVSNEVTSAQSLDRNIVSEATL